jgi:hypothetical protein
MKDIDLLHISFTKNDLDCIPDDEAIFVMQIGGLIHEVISLQKFIYMSSYRVEDAIQRMAENSQAMYFFRLLAGTLYEGWDLLTEKHNEYKIIIAKYKNNLDSVGKAAYDRLDKYFSNKKNSCEKIRNNFSHHYNYGEIKKMFNRWRDNDKFDIYLSEVHANCRYAISDVVTNLALLGVPKSQNAVDDLGALTKEIGEIAHDFIEMVSEYLSMILRNVIKEKNLQGDEVKIKDVPSLDELRLHYFIAEHNG